MAKATNQKKEAALTRLKQEIERLQQVENETDVEAIMMNSD